MDVVNMHDAKNSLSKLVKRAAAGEDAKHRKMPLASLKGKIYVTDDFDEPLEQFKEYM